MKILFLSHYSKLYGSNRSLYSLIQFFKKRGDETEVLLPSEGSFTEILRKDKIIVHKLRFFYETLYVKYNIKYLSLPFLWIYNLLAFPFLILTIKRVNPDVIYTNSSVDAYSIWVSKFLDIKHIVHVREFMFEDFGAGFLFGKKAKRAYLKKSNKIICVSQAVSQAVFGSIPWNGKVIYNGVKSVSEAVIDREPYRKSNIRLGVVGNIDISKQQDWAIRMMPAILEKYPNVTLHIVGEKRCKYKQYLLKLIDDLNLKENVILEGYIDNIDIIYDRIDVLLMCSRNEAFGRVTVEAMQRYIPVIGYNTGGTAEIVLNNVTGFLFNNEQDLLEAVDAIINCPNKIGNMVHEAKKRADTIFSEQEYCNKVYDFVHE